MTKSNRLYESWFITIDERAVHYKRTPNKRDMFIMTVVFIGLKNGKQNYI